MVNLVVNSCSRGCIVGLRTGRRLAFCHNKQDNRHSRPGAGRGCPVTLSIAISLEVAASVSGWCSEARGGVMLFGEASNMDTGGGNAGSSEAAKTSQNPTCETSQHSGCGCASGTTITVRVTPTTGGQFDLQVAKTESVENLKKLISKKLKVPKERICLLHRDRQLRDGTLQENTLMDGSRLTLLPSVETGLLVSNLIL
ncbi:hypothetical protein C0J52_04874 [Blattella germanica]|nr:hypothetical protein C0J52_04874 [Blattella germanica]